MSGTEQQSASAHDVADQLRDLLPDAGTLKIHKLLYYAQGWHLVWAGKPLFREHIEAWTKGPVVADLWYSEKHSRCRDQPTALTPEQTATVGYVVERYGHLTGSELVRLTHAEDPWRQASEQEEPWTDASPEIPHIALQRWFEKDDEQVAHRAEVERLLRQPAYSFAPLEMSPDLNAAIDATIRGERRQDTRPE